MILMPEQGKRTNLINRLIVIISEDISIDEFWLLEKSETILLKYSQLSQEPDLEDVRDLVELIFDYC